jgi:hypothetical protein
MNTAVQDAYNLGWKLGQVLRHGAPPSLLDTYEVERLPVAAHLLQFVLQMHKDWLGKAKDKEEPRRGEHMQLGLNYRGGPLSLDERGAVAEGVTRAGDSAPDAQLRDGDGDGASVRLFDLFRGPHFTLLALDGAALPAIGPQYGDALRVQRIARAGAAVPGALIDGDGQVQRIYGDGLILVRPDGYIGYTGPSGGAGLRVYLQRVFG